MAVIRGYSSGKFALELEGAAVGFVTSVEGGEAIGTVVVSPPGEDGIAKKQIASVGYDPITIQFGVGMGQELYDWIAEVLDRRQKPRSGAIAFLNYDFTEVRRLEWTQGLITEIVFPPAVGASKDQTLFTITIDPQTATFASSSGKAHTGFSAKQQKKSLSSNFAFSVTGLESASAKIASVQGLSVTQPLVREARDVAQPGLGALQVSNILVMVALASAQPWLDWVDDVLLRGQSEDDAERTATLRFLDATLKNPLFTLTLFHVGPVRAQRQKSVSGSDAVALVELELYCESVSFKAGANVTGSAIDAGSTDQPTGNQPIGVASTMDTTLALLAVAGGQIDAQRAMRVLQAGSLATSPELVAVRLKATETAAPLTAAQRTRADGESLGQQWASEHASLGELKTMAGLEAGNWSTIQLPDDHTLIAQLGRNGIVPPGGDGPLQLSRDEFIEGVVAGAVRVLRSAQPHLDGA
jgi:hypothetical protein